LADTKPGNPRLRDEADDERDLMNLEAAGLVVRWPHPEHGRVLQTYLTKEGEKSASKAHKIVGVIERRMLKGLSWEDQHRLLEALRGCADTLETGV
jgi:DNA-binding MarR family transcriptional regulator